MDEKKENQLPEEENRGYTPRPAYQVWMARLGLVLMIIFVIYQVLTIATGGF